jgi:hypothetical protein
MNYINNSHINNNTILFSLCNYRFNNSNIQEQINNMKLLNPESTLQDFIKTPPVCLNTDTNTILYNQCIILYVKSFENVLEHFSKLLNINRTNVPKCFPMLTNEEVIEWKQKYLK